MIKTYNKDALKWLRRKASKNFEVDLIVTDPPYKVTSRGGYTSAGGLLKDKDMRKGKVFKHNSVNIVDWLPLLYDVLKEEGHCYIMVNNKNLPHFIEVALRSNFHLIKILVWGKNNKIMSQAYMSQTEFILFLRKGSFKKIHNCGDSDLLLFDNPKNKRHPSEKPKDLLKVLVKNSSSKGDLVLDPFFGSGTTLEVCEELERDSVGLEIDKEMYKKFTSKKPD